MLAILVYAYCVGERSSRRIERRLVEDVAFRVVAAAEDETLEERTGGELPERWADRRDRRARLREALRQLDAQGAADWETYMADRAAKEAAAGRKLPGRKPQGQSQRGKVRHVNITDPESRMLRARNLSSRATTPKPR
jgi:hypothetical protein